MGQQCAKLLEDASKAVKDSNSAAPHATSKEKPRLSWQRGNPARNNAASSSAGKRDSFVASKNPADYSATGLRGMKWARLPGQINDQRINVDQCSECQFFLVDQCDSVQIDECKNCVFFIGPTMSSVFVRNCVDCVFIAACGQLRTRDLKRCTFSLLCSSRPVIESSTDLTFCCFSARHQYFLMAEHCNKARLSVFNNLYWNIHDFTPGAKQNYSFVDQLAFESSFDLAMLQLQQAQQQTTFATTLSAVPVLASGIPEYITQEEDLYVYTSEVIVPCTIGLHPSRAPSPNCSLRTLLVFGPEGLDEAFQLVRTVELQRREYYALQGLGPQEQLVQLVSTMENIITADDVQALLPLFLHADFWRAVNISNEKSSEGKMTQTRDRHPKMVEEAVRRMIGQACVFVLVATQVENPPLLYSQRCEIAKNAKSSKSIREQLLLDVTRPAGCEAMLRLSDQIFSSLPIQGMGFGSSH